MGTARWWRSGQNSSSGTAGTTRGSNGLKEFLWNLDGLGRGTLLDLGPAWQTTLTFFIERGFRVYVDDILRDWSQFLAEEEAKKGKENVTADDYAGRRRKREPSVFLEEKSAIPGGFVRRIAALGRAGLPGAIAGQAG